MNMKLEYIAVADDANRTVKDILLSRLHISHRLLITLKKENAIFLNDIPTVVYHRINPQDKITVSFDYSEDNSNILPKEFPLDIIYEDDWCLVVNKPPHIPVHPSMLHYEDSLSNGVKFYFDSIGLKKKIRPVNRIDKDTSGLVVFAKNEYVQENFIRQMKLGEFKKEYIAIVEGYFTKKMGTINAPIARKENSIIERCVQSDGALSITHYEVLEEFNIQEIPISILKCKLETGRTHQIRVHMAYLGHPLLGDDLYDGNSTLINRQALHSSYISFIHPISKQVMHYQAPFPNDLSCLLEKHIKNGINSF